MVFKKLRRWYRRWKYQEGKTLTRFIACDIVRDIEIISTARIDEGIIVGRVRTTNVLYVNGGLMDQPEFEHAQELNIDQLWRWTGKHWGGLTDGTSLAASKPTNSTS